MSWKDRKAFVADLKLIYRAPTREKAEAELESLDATWSDRYPMAVRSWQNNWERLATFFDFPAEIPPADLHHQQRRGVQPAAEEGDQDQVFVPHARGSTQAPLPGDRGYHEQMDRGPIRLWPKILNQLAIRFEDRITT